nr:hypothetical protein [Tanacetum cinerariifolium]
LFSTIKVVSRHQTTQLYGAILPIELTIDEIKNSKAYKEYYACVTGEAAPKPKASARKKKGDSASSTTPPTPTPTTTVESAPRLSATAKGKQPARATTPTKPTDMERTEAEQLKIVLKRSRQETQISQQSGFGTDEGTGSRPGVPDVPSDDLEEELSWNSSDDEDSDEEDTETGKGGDEVSESKGDSDEEETRQEEELSFDPIPRTPEESEDEINDEEDQELRLSEEARIQEEEDADELEAPIPPPTIPSIILKNLPTFNSTFRFNERLRSLETSFLEYRQTNPFVDAVSAIPGIVHQYITQQMTDAVREAVQIQTDRLQDSLQRENDEFLRNIDKNIKKIIKEQVKNQVKEQVSRILPRIEESVNATLEAEMECYHSVTKTKAADYGHIKWIEDLVPRAMWIPQPIDYNRHALWGVSHWGRKHQQFYGYAVNREFALDV